MPYVSGDTPSVSIAKGSSLTGVLNRCAGIPRGSGKSLDPRGRNLERDRVAADNWCVDDEVRDLGLQSVFSCRIAKEHRAARDEGCAIGHLSGDGSGLRVDRDHIGQCLRVVRVQHAGLTEARACCLAVTGLVDGERPKSDLRTVGFEHQRRLSSVGRQRGAVRSTKRERVDVVARERVGAIGFGELCCVETVGD